jgi:hypothetical protein
MDYSERLTSLEYFFKCFNSVISTASSSNEGIENAANTAMQRTVLENTLTSKHRKAIEEAARKLMLYHEEERNDINLAVITPPTSSQGINLSGRKRKKNPSEEQTNPLFIASSESDKMQATCSAHVLSEENNDTDVVVLPFKRVQLDVDNITSDGNTTSSTSDNKQQDHSLNIPSSPASFKSRSTTTTKIPPHIKNSSLASNNPIDLSVIVTSTPVTTTTTTTTATSKSTKDVFGCSTQLFPNSFHRASVIDKTKFEPEGIDIESFENLLFQATKQRIAANDNDIQSSWWEVQISYLELLKVDPFVSLATLANIYKNQLSKTVENYIEDVKSILKIYGCFNLTFPVSFIDDIYQHSENTPGNGFCFYLMHFQARQCYLKYNGIHYDPLPSNFQYMNEEFKTLLEEEIVFLNEKLKIDNYATKGEGSSKEIDQTLVLQLKNVLMYIENLDNMKGNKIFPNGIIKWKSNKRSVAQEMEFSTWGYMAAMGRILLASANIPFPMFRPAETIRNGESIVNIKLSSFSLNPPQRYFKYDSIYQTILSCQQFRFGGFFDGVNHFHLIPIPSISIDGWRKVEHAFASAIALLFYNVDTSFPQMLLQKVLERAVAEERAGINPDIVEID